MIKAILKWFLGILALILIGILLFTSISQAIYDNKVAKNYKPTGKLAEVAGNKIHYEMIGDGEVTFVMIAGLGENNDTWKMVKDSMANMGRVFMFDRPGLGFSDRSSKPRTTEQISIELNELMNMENIPGPYILVGHSIGGAHIRYYAHMFPDDVSGLFLIDPSHEKMKDDAPEPSFFFKFFNYSAINLSWSGIPFYLLPSPPHPNYKTSRSIKTYGREIDAIDVSIEQFKASNMDLSALPIYIISATANSGENEEKFMGYMQELIQHSSSEIKKHVIYEKPHHIHVTDPELVLSELREFTNRLTSADSTVFIDD